MHPIFFCLVLPFCRLFQRRADRFRLLISGMCPSTIYLLQHQESQSLPLHLCLFPINISKKPVNADVYGPSVAIATAPRVGLEPTTTRLTAECSTIDRYATGKSKEAFPACPMKMFLIQLPVVRNIICRPHGRIFSVYLGQMLMYGKEASD